MSQHSLSLIRQSALNFLARREHSADELKRKLLQRGFDLEAIETVLADLKKSGLQSDQRFAEFYVRSRAERGFGPMLIKAELRQRGIDDELIKSNLDEKAESWLESLIKVSKKKVGADLSKDFSKKAKLLHFLKYRGFNEEQIKCAFAGLLDFKEL